MSRHHRSSVFGACLVTTAMLFACPVYAKPGDYNIELVDASHGKVKVHLSDKIKKKDVIGAVIRADGSLGSEGHPSMVVPMRAVPTSTPGEYAFKIEPGMEVFDLDLEADVPGEAEKVTKKIHVKDPKSK